MHGNIFEYCLVIIALFITSNLWFYLRVLRPLKQLSLQAGQLKSGDFAAFEQQGDGLPEIQELRRAMAGMVGHVRRSHEQSRAYAEGLADIQEHERKRVAHELHDETLQSLIAINQSIELARIWMQTDPERAEKLLKDTRQQVLETATGLRSLIGGLRPPAIDELGLVAALQIEAAKVSELHVDVRVEGTQRRLDEARELTLFRAAQEALSNTRRHSQAKSACITIRYAADGVSVRVSDDGRGFTMPTHLSDLGLSHHYGLLGMQERSQYVGGHATVESAPGQGTIVEVSLPFEPLLLPDGLVTDPVCNARLEPQQAYSNTVYKGKTYYFCCPVCEGAFQKAPNLYLNIPSP